jgi:hypothetical protein
MKEVQTALNKGGRGMRPDARDEYLGYANRTPLMVAVNYEQMDVIRYLIERGADVNAADDVSNDISICYVYIDLLLCNYTIQYDTKFHFCPSSA